METQTIEQRIATKVATYKAEVEARELTVAEKRLASYQGLMNHRRAVFETTDTQNRLRLLPHNNDYCLLISFSDRDRRAVTRKEFRESIKEALAHGGITNPEVIAEYRSYLREDKNTPYARKPLLERLSETYDKCMKEIFPWK